ncbi:MAG: alpha/beta fold hydrolase [Hyphomicrobiaceae bacterium]
MPLAPVAIPAQVAAHEGLVDVGDARLWYSDTGGSGAPIVLCHPASQSSLIWLYQQPVFAAAGYRVIAYCRRGVYRSEAGPKETGATTVGDLRRLLDGLRIETAQLLGAAAGGISALGFTVARPERVRSLVLAGTIFSPNEGSWRQMYDRLGLAAARKALGTDFLELGPSYRASNPEGVAKFLELEHHAKVGPPTSLPLGVDVTWATIASANVPTLLLTGEADLYAPPPLQALVARHMPRHEITTLREVGHAPYWEAPEVFNRLVLEFLGRQP